MFRKLLLLSLLAFGLHAHVARADDCAVITTAVAFGAYDPVSASPKDAQGTLRIECDKNKKTVTIALGTGNTGTVANRLMRSNGNPMNYNLYKDAARATIFGNTGAAMGTCTTGTGNVVDGCTGSNGGGKGFQATRPIYGRIPANQDVAAGTYGDQVTVTVTF